MAPEIWILGIVLVGIAFVAVPAIVRGSLLPRDLEIETVPEEALTETQRRHFQSLDAVLAQLGYGPLANFVARNLQGANLTRYYRSDYDPAVLGASCLRGVNFVDEKDQGSMVYGEWITKYEDGTSLNTLNATVSDLFDRMPHQIRQRFPGLGDVARLKARHDQKAAGLLGRQPRFAHGRDVVEEWRDYHRRWCQFQVGRGLLRPDPEVGGYRVTRRLAWRGVLSFLNPLADNFGLSRFVPALALGCGLPALALWLARDTQLPERLAQTLGLAPQVSALGLSLLAFALAGAAIGWLFETKSFIWGLLLGYLPLRLLGGGLGLGERLVLLLCMAFVADRVAKLRTRRRMIV